MVELPVLTALPAPSDELFEELERDNHIKLPNEFISFFRKYNEATLDYVMFQDGHRERLIERFLCLIADFDTNPLGIYHIEAVLAQIGERLVDESAEHRVGYNVIPFGVLFAGDFVCLDCRGSGEPAVVVWDHEQSDDFAPVLSKIANTFSEFEHLLHQKRPQPLRRVLCRDFPNTDPQYAGISKCAKR